MHIKSSLTLASLKNHVRKVHIENLIRNDTLRTAVTCVTLTIINEAGRVSEFAYFSFLIFIFRLSIVHN